MTEEIQIPLSPQRKPKTKVLGFFICKKCQKFTFEYFFTYKKSKDVEHPLRFPLQVHPSGLSGANPVSFSAGFLKNLIKTL
jgi:hypothetical protein